MVIQKSWDGVAACGDMRAELRTLHINYWAVILIKITIKQQQTLQYRE